MHNRNPTRVEDFQYPASTNPLLRLWEDVPEIGTTSSRMQSDDGLKGNINRDTVSPEPSSALATEEATRSFEAGREQGILEARGTAAIEQRTRLQEDEKKRICEAAKLANQFASERDRFLQTVEHEVVKLALAIAARILRREAQIDPLFLIGAVRVALGQLAATLRVKLRIPTSEAELWSETLANLPNLKIKPRVTPDDHLHLGDCVIEAEMGSVDLGVNAQLREVERALFHASNSEKLESETNRDQSGNKEQM